MDSQYDIFQKLSDGSKMWVCSVDGFTEAKIMAAKLGRTRPAEYYICDLLARRVVAAINTDFPGLRTQVRNWEVFNA